MTKQRKPRTHKCEYCNREMKVLSNCLTCKEEAVMKSKVKKVMEEFKEGSLRTGRGNPVKTRVQAVAIALDEGRAAVKASHKRKKK